ncbi:hypothetical protein DW064_09810 [Segatella copri]|uniref:Uncharacterized protein n=1 Tax=Segatella copri TaxID=165179 RepID=A0AA92V6Z0_9BACT|nr:hypothetical protein DW064_09810 [Segatella copri]
MDNIIIFMMNFFFILIFIFCGAFFAFILNALYKRTNDYRNIFADTEKFRNDDSIPNGLQLVNLGSNHPKFGFHYDGLNVKAMNWAVGPQSLEYDFAILRKECHHLADNAVVLIPICVLKMFLYRHPFGEHLKYYGILPKDDIVGYTQKTKNTHIDYPLLFHPKKIKRLIKDVPAVTNNLLIDTNPMNETQLKADADFWINCWNREFDIDINNLVLSDINKTNIKRNIHLLNEMIQFCLDRKLRPVICILPVTDYLGSRFSEDFVKNQILAYVNEANTQKCPVLNHLKDSRFTDSSLYINSFFFNLQGRKQFTKMIIEELKDNQIL